MNKTIFKNTFKRSWKLLLIFFVVLCFYQILIISLIDPDDMDKVRELFGSMKDYMGAFSISIADMTTPLNYTASTFFSILVMAFTMVFYVIQVNGLLVKQVDDTSIACTLACPVKRSTLIITRGIYLIFAMAVLFLGILVSGAVMLNTYGDFDFPAYLNLVGVTFLLCTAIAMLSYFLSALFCNTKFGTGISVGVPIALLFISMIGGAGGDKTKWLQKITPFGWLDSVGIVTGNVETGWMYLVLSLAVIVLLLGSAAVFQQKQLSI